MPAAANSLRQGVGPIVTMVHLQSSLARCNASHRVRSAVPPPRSVSSQTFTKTTFTERSATSLTLAAISSAACLEVAPQPVALGGVIGGRGQSGYRKLV